MVGQLWLEWRLLWYERADCTVRAEGWLCGHCKLFVDKGSVIHAIRDFEALSFREILEKNNVENAERFVPPSPVVGGWSKFA